MEKEYPLDNPKSLTRHQSVPRTHSLSPPGKRKERVFIYLNNLDLSLSIKINNYLTKLQRSYLSASTFLSSTELLAINIIMNWPNSTQFIDKNAGQGSQDNWSITFKISIFLKINLIIPSFNSDMSIKLLVSLFQLCLDIAQYTMAVYLWQTLIISFRLSFSLSPNVVLKFFSSGCWRHCLVINFS